MRYTLFNASPYKKLVGGVPPPVLHICPSEWENQNYTVTYVTYAVTYVTLRTITTLRTVTYVQVKYAGYNSVVPLLSTGYCTCAYGELYVLLQNVRNVRYRLHTGIPRLLVTDTGNTYYQEYW